jgi:polysaccharide export outer membrane protein
LRLPRITSQQKSRQPTRKLGALSAAAAVAAAALLSGCNSKSFLDPGELSRGGVSERRTVKILDQIEPGVETYDPRFPAAEEPRAEDLVQTITDYTMGPGDVVDVAVTDLTGTGVESVNTRQVTESGNIILPLLKQPVRAEGLTEPELAQAVAQAYKNENIIQDAQVSVTLRVKRARTFFIRGAISQPGEYEIATNDFRLLNALVQARDISQGQAAGVDYIFVIRKAKFDPSRAGAAAPGTTAPATKTGGRDPLAPQSRAKPAGSHVVKPVALMQNNPAPADAPTAANAPATVPAAGETEGRFIIVDGKPVQVGAQPKATPAAAQQTAPAPGARSAQAPAAGGATGAAGTTSGGFAFNAPEAEGETRIIRIPFDALRNGDLKYNIVVRPQDMIVVPEPRVQTYYMGGHVLAPGAYQMIPGNKLTLMEAIISARMLDGLAIPARTDVIRRVGDEKVYVRVDLEKIFAGQHPDIYIKENDNVMVGTNAVAPFLAAFRNAFRVTYGFGFLYDRNFAAAENNKGINN